MARVRRMALRQIWSPAIQKKQYVLPRTSYQFNFQSVIQRGNGIQAAGPTQPRDHTSIRVGAFYYYGTNQQNFGNGEFTGLNFNTINEPFYRVGGDLSIPLSKVGSLWRRATWWTRPKSSCRYGRRNDRQGFLGYLHRVGFVAGNYWI